MNKLLGNERAQGTLAAWIRGGRLPHAVLIEGPAGSGKKTLARQAGAGALCEAPREERPCGGCRHCRKVEKDIHPDFLTFSGEGGARSFHIDTVRSIREQAHVRPNEADAKAFLLVDVHTMSPQAQNALLKLLEEPPKGVLFLLTCENKAALLGTVLSRVALLSLEPPPPELCEQALSALAPDTEPERRRAVALESAGNVGRALALLAEGDGGSGPYRQALEVLLALHGRRELDALEVLARYDRDRPGFLRLLSLMRDILSTLAVRPPTAGEELALAENITALRLAEIVAIIDETAAAAAGNASLSLTGTVLCARVRQAFVDR